MNFQRFRYLMQPFPVFSLQDVRAVDPAFDRRRLSEWREKGYLQKIIKGHYVMSDRDKDDDLLHIIANKMYRPCYVSFESALAFYHLIPETVYGIISATSRRTYVFQTELGTFSYKTVKPEFLFGYSVLENGVRMATPEKALIDFFYGHHDMEDEEGFQSIRMDRQAFVENINPQTVEDYLSRMGKKRLTGRVCDFIDWMGQNHA